MERFDNKVLTALQLIIDNFASTKAALLSNDTEKDVLAAQLISITLSKQGSASKVAHDEHQDFKWIPSVELCYDLSRRCQFRTNTTEAESLQSIKGAFDCTL